jgi:hypothetical protein
LVVVVSMVVVVVSMVVVSVVSVVVVSVRSVVSPPHYGTTNGEGSKDPVSRAALGMGIF